MAPVSSRTTQPQNKELETTTDGNSTENNRNSSDAPLPPCLPDSRKVNPSAIEDTEQQAALTTLRETERRLLVAQSVARIGSWEFDVVSGIITWSPETFRLLEFDPTKGEPDFETLQQRYHPDDRAGHAAAVNLAVTKAIPYEINLRAVLGDGSIRWLRSTAHVHQSEDGSVMRLYGVLQDITDRKQVHDALTRSERQYRQIVETANDGIWSTDSEGRIVFVNPKMADMLGYTEEELIGKTADFVGSEKSARQLLAGLERRRQGFSDQYETQLIAKNGREFWVNISASPILSPAGHFQGTLAMVIDISEQKRSEAALQESELRFRSTFDAAAAGMTINGLDGFLLQVNDAFCRFVGHDRDYLIGTHISSLSDPNTMGRIGDMRRRCLSGEISFYRLEKCYRHKDGRPIWADLTSSLVRDSRTGEPLYFIAQIIDITARKRLEQQMIQAEKLAAIGELVTGVAHEINNPLAVISGQAQILEMHSDQQVRDDARIIREMTERVSRIVRSLRSYAQPSDLDALARKKAGDLNTVVRAALEVMTYKMRDRDITVETDLSPELLSIPMSVGEIEQVLVNLLSNAAYAVQELPLARRNIRIRTWHTPPGGDCDGMGAAALSVTDTGRGMSPEIASRVFDPFFTTKDTDEGTGLGLYISHSILTAHGGTIGVESQEKEGTTFTLCLPYE